MLTIGSKKMMEKLIVFKWLDVSPQNSYVQALSPNAVVCEDGALEGGQG